MPLNPTNLNEASANKNPERWEVSVRFDRPLDHPRDDLAVLKSTCSVFFTAHPDFDSDRLSLIDVAVDTETGTATIVLEGDQKVTDLMAIRTLRYKILPKYNEAEETNRENLVTPTRSTTGDPVGTAHQVYLNLPEDQRNWENFLETAPQRHNASIVSEDEWRDAFERVEEHEQQPDSAPDVQIDEVYVRALPGDPAPFDAPDVGGDR